MVQLSEIKKILVIKLRQIGDVVLTIPVFKALREKFTNTQIYALVNSGTEEVLQGLKYIDGIFIYDRRIKKYPLFKKIEAEIDFFRSFKKEGFDLTIDLTSGDRAALVSYVSGAKLRLAYDPENSGFLGKKFLYTHLAKRDVSIHMVLQNINILKLLDINCLDNSLDFHIPQKDKLTMENFLKENGIDITKDKIVHIHPVAKWLFKCWKDEYMAEVINWLIEKDVKVVITSSNNKREMEKIKAILSMIKDRNSKKMGNILDMSGKTTLKQLAALSFYSKIFFGIDTAPMHIAAAVGTPVIALFGPTDEKQWAPWGQGHTVIKENLSCMPCKKGSCAGIIMRKCMEAIKPDVVKRVIQEKLRD